MTKLLVISVLLVSPLSWAIDTEMRDAEAVAKSLVGLTHRQVYDSFRKKNRLWDCNSSWSSRRDNGKIVGVARNQIGIGRYLILSYAGIKDPLGNIKDNDRVTSAETVSFSDRKMELFKQLPDPIWDCVKLIHNSSRPGPEEFDPISVIRAVNGLRTKEKDVVVNALLAYRRAATDYSNQDRWIYDLDQEKIPVICHLLFAPSNGAPEMLAFPFHGYHADTDVARKTWPLFPLVVIEDIPFYLAQQGPRFGPPYDPRDLIEYCRCYCSLRRKPLVPGVSPIEAVDTIYTCKTWQHIFHGKDWRELDEGVSDGTRNKYFIREQAFRCVHKYLPEETGPQFDFRLFPSDTFGDNLWREYLSKLGQPCFVWNSVTQEFSPVVQKGRVANHGIDDIIVFATGVSPA